MESLKSQIKQLATSEGKTEIEIITGLQVAATRTGDEELLEKLCQLKRTYIYWSKTLNKWVTIPE